ncbi:MarC family protein [Dyadobacter sp. CY323]|uniref:MarC family protein n=1 Tax=Dyadobacter sp. CY323 TaxID=2907302 RepID=UPI001F215886|nr:MarC family protein [Dyadobacter sp. CY323]MCE6991682.1 MarC family protein [Dyadobacter sp. CY323]
MFNFKEIVSVTLILFSVIDVLGSLPVIVDFRKKLGKIESEKATLVAGFIMVLFLFLGERLLSLFGVDVASFAIAGAIILFLLGLEMILGRNIFKHDNLDVGVASIVPIAFPIIAGAATMTTLLSLRSAYQIPNILVGIVLNLFFVYLVLKSSTWIEKKLGQGGTDILRKIFGIILLAIAIKLFKTNLSM